MGWKYKIHEKNSYVKFRPVKEEFEYFFFSFIFISWRLITLQYCSGIVVSIFKVDNSKYQITVIFKFHWIRVEK